jgi:hypothetical protein
MKPTGAFPILKRLAFIAGVILAFSISSAAQVDVAISRASALPTAGNSDHWQVNVAFTQGFDIPKLRNDLRDAKKGAIKNPANFRLIDVLNGQRINVTFVYIDVDDHYDASGVINNQGLPGSLVLYLDPSTRLTRCRPYHLYIFDVTFEGGKAPKGALEKRIDFPTEKCEGVATSKPSAVALPPTTSSLPPEKEKEDSVALTAADGREDANIYLSGEITGARGKRAAGSADVKIEIPIAKVIGDRIHYFDPFFELKASNDPGRDPDSLSFGLAWEFPLLRYRGSNLGVPFRRLVWRNSPKIEAERDFDNANFIWESRFKLLSRTWSGPGATFYFRPFFGFELGANIVSPLAEAEGRFLFRPIAGTTLNLVFPIQKSGLQDIGFEASYIRRWPLRRELSFEEDDDGNLKLLENGTDPRDYVKANFNISFTKKFGLTLGYEYGQLPPSFKLVDSKYGIGLTFKAKIDREQ